jgi:predicted transcriptional regulator
MRQLSIKQTTLEVIRSLPESTSLEEIMYQINLAAQTLEGLKDIREGRTVTSNELLNKLDKWNKGE